MFFILAILLILVVVAIAAADARDVAVSRLGWRIGFLLLLFVGAIFGFQIRLIRSINCMPNCTGVNFVGRDLDNRDLKGINLVEAQMARAKLSHADLQNADISGADLKNADLKNANLSFAFLIGTNLVDSDFTGATLFNTSLQGANLTSSNLSGIDMTQTNIQGAVFNKAVMVGVNLQENSLSGLELREADLSGADLRGATLAGTSLSGANLSGANLRGADLEGAYLNLVDLTGADLTDANLSGASLIGADLSSVVLQHASLVGALIMGADFDGADLRGANLNYVRGLNQVTDQDIEIDPVLKNLNSLQKQALRTPVSIEGVIINESTIVNEALLPPVAEDVQDEQALTVRVGILHSVSGDLAFSESAILDATLLAVEEINKEGGILGKQIATYVEDGASNPTVYADKTTKLLEINQVDVIFGVGTSRSRAIVTPILEEHNGLLFYPVQYEGLESSPQIIYMGAEPSQQVIPTIEYLIDDSYESFYLLGTDTAYSRVVNSIIKAQLAEEGLAISGETLLPFGDMSLEPIVRQIEFLKPDMVLSTLVGGSAGAFFNQLQTDQISAATFPVLSFNLSELEVKAFGAEQLEGHLTATNYYQTLGTVTNFSFVEAYKGTYGRESVTSSSIVGGYNAVYLWKALVEAAGSFEVDALLEAGKTQEIIFDSPSGEVRFDPESQHLYQALRIGRIRGDGLIEEISEQEWVIRPDPFLHSFPWAESLVERHLTVSP